ncbi:MAG TPA: GNAT family N-acetyltransferase [Mycobacterium sp.]|nr:GNAT family N-acetyltransferase [Mycobacterium sp.]
MTLRDGATVQMRRLGYADRDAVIELHDTLTEDERYLRFFTMHPAYLETLAHKLTEDSGEDYALGAFLRLNEGAWYNYGALVGVANYVVCDRPDSAEWAIVVAHNDHERGVGKALLRTLAQVARRNGIQYFVADVLTTNHLMFRLLDDAGLQPGDTGSEDGVVHLEVSLAEIAGLI